MLSKVLLFGVSSALLFAKAVASEALGPVGVRQTSIQCTTGIPECCISLSSASDSVTAALLDLFGIDPLTVPDKVGLGCSTITDTGPECIQTPLCCTGHDFNGMVTLECTPPSV